MRIGSGQTLKFPIFAPDTSLLRVYGSSILIRKLSPGRAMSVHNPKIQHSTPSTSFTCTPSRSVACLHGHLVRCPHEFPLGCSDVSAGFRADERVVSPGSPVPRRTPTFSLARSCSRPRKWAPSTFGFITLSHVCSSLSAKQRIRRSIRLTKVVRVRQMSSAESSRRVVRTCLMQYYLMEVPTSPPPSPPAVLWLRGYSADTCGLS